MADDTHRYHSGLLIQIGYHSIFRGNYIKLLLPDEGPNEAAK